MVKEKLTGYNIAKQKKNMKMRICQRLVLLGFILTFLMTSCHKDRFNRDIPSAVNGLGEPSDSATIEQNGGRQVQRYSRSASGIYSATLRIQDLFTLGIGRDQIMQRALGISAMASRHDYYEIGPNSLNWPHNRTRYERMISRMGTLGVGVGDVRIETNDAITTQSGFSEVSRSVVGRFEYDNSRGASDFRFERSFTSELSHQFTWTIGYNSRVNKGFRGTISIGGLMQMVPFGQSASGNNEGRSERRENRTASGSVVVPRGRRAVIEFDRVRYLHSGTYRAPLILTGTFAAEYGEMSSLTRTLNASSLTGSQVYSIQNGSVRLLREELVARVRVL